jgi:hypothetical protein
MILLPSGTPPESDAERLLLAGDYDANGVAGASDLAVFTGQFGLAAFPGSGFVDGVDFLIWQRQFGATAAAEVGAASALAVDAVALEEIEIGTFQLLLTPTASGSRGVVARRPEWNLFMQQVTSATASPPRVSGTDHESTPLAPVRDLAEADGETVAAASDAALELMFFRGIGG